MSAPGRDALPWVLLALVCLAYGAQVLAEEPAPELDLELLHRTLAIAERCSEATHTALQALLPRYDTLSPAP